MYCSGLQRYIIFSENFYPLRFNISLTLYGLVSQDATCKADGDDGIDRVAAEGGLALIRYLGKAFAGYSVIQPGPAPIIASRN